MDGTFLDTVCEQTNFVNGEVSGLYSEEHKEALTFWRGSRKPDVMKGDKAAKLHIEKWDVVSYSSRRNVGVAHFYVRTRRTLNSKRRVFLTHRSA